MVKLYTKEDRDMWFLYVLLLEDDFYYVGISLYPNERIDAHFQGLGANFTKIHKPIKVAELYCLWEKDKKVSYKIETIKTKEYRNLYGANKVVGGKLLSLGKVA